MKLISCTDYVISDSIKSDSNTSERIIKYANFLKRQLELGMFIPCDLEGNMLLTPIEWRKKTRTKGLITVGNYSNPAYKEYIKQYQEAKNRVLFEGFEVVKTYNEEEDFNEYTVANIFIKVGGSNWNNYTNYKTIEDLTNLDLTLTDNAIKQIMI